MKMTELLYACTVAAQACLLLLLLLLAIASTNQIPASNGPTITLATDTGEMQ